MSCVQSAFVDVTEVDGWFIKVKIGIGRRSEFKMVKRRLIADAGVSLLINFSKCASVFYYVTILKKAIEEMWCRVRNNLHLWIFREMEIHNDLVWGAICPYLFWWES